MDIMVLPGDGIGPEIMRSALRILEIMRSNFNVKIESQVYDNINARNIASGKVTLDYVLDEARKYRAILKGPMGDPNIRTKDGVEAGLDIILGLRFNLDLYANVRPIKLLPGVQSPLRDYGDGSKTIDYVLIRENSEGLYSSHFGGLILRDDVAIDIQTITRKGTERIVRFAFELARRSKGNAYGEKVVTCVDKSNVLKSFYFFRKVFTEVARNYSDVKYNFMYADAMAQFMILHPEMLNIVVTENMFGDILSELAAATVGGVGLAWSGNIGDDRAMFEPVHGSAPDIAGKGIANPTAMIMATSMMLDWLGYSREAKIIEDAILDVLRSGVRTPDIGGKVTTEEFTNEIINRVLRR